MKERLNGFYVIFDVLNYENIRIFLRCVCVCYYVFGGMGGFDVYFGIFIILILVEVFY